MSSSRSGSKDRANTVTSTQVSYWAFGTVRIQSEHVLSDRETDSVEAIRCKRKLFQCTKQESSEYSLLIVPNPIQVMGIY